MAIENAQPHSPILSNSSGHNNLDRSDQDGQAHWSTYSFVQLIVSSLPVGTTTLEIYNNFKRYGNVSRISIFDLRQDDRGTRAEVFFEPPPRYPVWERVRVSFTASTGLTKMVHLKLSTSQPKSFKVESPVHRGVMYTEKLELLASSLTWGVLKEPEKMMTMASTSNTAENVRLVLNLRRREIEIHFPFVFRSENRVATRAFRFAIALNDDFAIWKLSGRSYVLSLSGIPWYSKQLKEAVAQTHNPDNKRWSEEDTWARQTDIFEHKSNHELIKKTPVSLQKNLNSINIARWRTFHIQLLDTEENKAADKIFRNALKDFNVKVHDGSKFQIIEGSPQLDHQVWNRIDGQRKGNKPLSLAEELSQSHLTFPVRYQLEVCLSQGWLSEYQITSEFLQKLTSIDEGQARQMLIYVDSYQQRLWNPMEIFTELRYRRPVKKRPLPEYCVEVHSATVTATSILWHTPTVEITNRVVRRHKLYADRFLRVRFEDDEYRGQSRLYSSSNNKMILILQRVKRTLKHGIRLGDRHYEFLAWGNSQLRDHGVYFFARSETISASSILADMGVFDQEKIVAKRAARMGQCFSTTKPVHLRLPAASLHNTIPDVQQGKFVFTDGVGKISPLAAQVVHQQLKIRGPVPSAFQFRLGGCKGVLVVWHDLSGIDIKVRKSQFKFDSTSKDLEIIRWSEFWQPFLNRQIIICLSNLGVPNSVFLKKQEQTIRALEAAMKDDKAAVKALRENVDPNLMTLSMVELVDAGFRASKEPFVTSILHLWKAWSLKYLKEKAKIPVPQGAFVLGCVDETNSLRGHFDNLRPHPDASVSEKTKTLPEIFIQITDPQNNQRRIIEGVCVLARNPSLHRGDIRVVKAVNIPALKHLCDVVVMPANGDRDLPSMCSGGDLDGDDYMVIWDQELIPQMWNAEPFHYNPPPPKTAVGEITTDDIINFFYDYLQNDQLGRIAHAHLAAADFLDEGIESQTCLDLVHLHSMAVDYPKTGVPAIMERRLERNAWPHFMDKKGSTYRSHKVLGKLYDAVERVSFNPTHNLPFDTRILNAYKPSEEMLRSVQDIKQDYDNALQRIMAQHNIRTEYEVWSTFVLDHSKASRDFKFHEEIGQLSSTLKEQYYEACCLLAGGKDFEHLAPVAVAAYHYTNAMVQTATKEVEQGLRYGGTEGMPFTSFPWILKDTLCNLARRADSLICKHGSTTIVKDGKLIAADKNIDFDDTGKAQIRVQDPSDIEFSHAMHFSGHLPDPYQPGQDDDMRSLLQDDLAGSSSHALDPSIGLTTYNGTDTKVEPSLEPKATFVVPASSDTSSKSLLRIDNGESHGTLLVEADLTTQAPKNSVDKPSAYNFSSGREDSSKGYTCSSIQDRADSKQSSIADLSSAGNDDIDISNTMRTIQTCPRFPEEAQNGQGSMFKGEVSKAGEEDQADNAKESFIMDDPLNMTAEQLKALGLDDDDIDI